MFNHQLVKHVLVAVPWAPFELPLREPQLLGGEVKGLCVEHAVVVHQNLLVRVCAPVGEAGEAGRAERAEWEGRKGGRGVVGKGEDVIREDVIRI